MNFAKLADLFCYILWQQQGIYIKPYSSYENLTQQNAKDLRKGIESVLLAFKALRVKPETYLEYNRVTGLLEERISLYCVGVEKPQTAESIADLLFSKPL